MSGEEEVQAAVDAVFDFGGFEDSEEEEVLPPGVRPLTEADWEAIRANRREA
jgi:hypothetical protein